LQGNSQLGRFRDLAFLLGIARVVVLAPVLVLALVVVLAAALAVPP
jgi:hypothetical protein